MIGALGLISGRIWKAIGPSGLAIGALLIALVLYRGEARHWHNRYDREVALHKTDLDATRLASAKAQADAHAAAVAQEARDKAKAEKVDHDAQIAIADAQRRADAYIAAHRVRTSPAADSGRPSDAGMPQAADTAQGDHGPGGDAIVVTADDVKVCTDNTERLIAAHGWATRKEP